MKRSPSSYRKIYVAYASFYEAESLIYEIENVSRIPLASGFNRKKVIKKAVENLKCKHRRMPFPSYFFGSKPNKITSHFVKIEEIVFVK